MLKKIYSDDSAVELSYQIGIWFGIKYCASLFVRAYFKLFNVIWVNMVVEQELVRAEVLPADYNFEEHKKLVPMQPGDVPVTYADTSALERDYGFKPATSLREGLRRFAEWYKEFYKV